jgi:cupin fold WbuC family metalloprotein
VKIIARQTLCELSTAAASSTRLRRNLNLHPSYADSVQRLFNAMEPGTYVHPHRHRESDKWELFLVLSGAVAVLSFDDLGKVTKRIELTTEGPILGIEIPEGTWHTLVALVPGTVVFECKRGPYQPLTDKDFAVWAPQEGDPKAAVFVAWFRQAAIGHIPPPA